MEAEDTPDNEETIEEPPKKQRPPKSKAQMAAFEKARKIKEENARRRKEAEDELLAQSKKALETKVVQKAISIKKKQIKAQLALDELSSDDEPIEAVKQKASRVRPVAPPVFMFV